MRGQTDFTKVCSPKGAKGVKHQELNSEPRVSLQVFKVYSLRYWRCQTGPPGRRDCAPGKGHHDRTEHSDLAACSPRIVRM
ncbi:hypothetical protein T492DRAFT_1052904 [Pavlovales sp. CCMP2436]|nr:hypothetical protein T492DRAFT_1052904 [Pavlovales sp. CCMP2436]